MSQCVGGACCSTCRGSGTVAVKVKGDVDQSLKCPACRGTGERRLMTK